MIERADRNTGIRLTSEQMSKVNALAAQLGISRNRTIAKLIEQAQVVTVAQVKVALPAPVIEEAANVHP